LGFLFLINAIDSSIIAKKRGRIIHVGNSGTVVVGEVVVVGEELVVGGVGDEVDVCVGVAVGAEVGVTVGEDVVGAGVEDGLGDGDGVDVAAVKAILT
jgi:hypothetical protein